MFKSLALIATVASSAAVTLDGAVAQKDGSPAVATLPAKTSRSATCVAQSGYKLVTADTNMMAYASVQMTLKDTVTAYDWAITANDATTKWNARIQIAGAANPTTFPTFTADVQDNVLTDSSITYSDAAAIPTATTADAVYAAPANGAKVNQWSTTSSSITNAGMPVADGSWIYMASKSSVAAGTASVDPVGELTISKKLVTKATIDAFALKEKMTVACGLNINRDSEDKIGQVKNAEWTFATAGAAATMAGASVVAAAALLF